MLETDKGLLKTTPLIVKTLSLPIKETPILAFKTGSTLYIGTKSGQLYTASAGADSRIAAAEAVSESVYDIVYDIAEQNGFFYFLTGKTAYKASYEESTVYSLLRIPIKPIWNRITATLCCGRKIHAKTFSLFLKAERQKSCLRRYSRCKRCTHSSISWPRLKGIHGSSCTIFKPETRRSRIREPAFRMYCCMQTIGCMPQKRCRQSQVRPHTNKSFDTGNRRGNPIGSRHKLFAFAGFGRRRPFLRCCPFILAGRRKPHRNIRFFSRNKTIQSRF